MFGCIFGIFGFLGKRGTHLHCLPSCGSANDHHPSDFLTVLQQLSLIVVIISIIYLHKIIQFLYILYQNYARDLSINVFIRNVIVLALMLFSDCFDSFLRLFVRCYKNDSRLSNLKNTFVRIKM